MLFRTVRRMFTSANTALHGVVLNFFRSLNRLVESKLRVWYIRKETSEHFRLLAQVFTWVVLPATLFHVFTAIYFFGENPLDSVFLGVLVFLYSNFLPDLPSAYTDRKDNAMTKPLPWYKKYALLLFAPIFIWLLYSSVHLRWKTTETFHNFKSLAIYAVFLVLCGFLAFGDPPISIGDIAEVISLPLYGIAGYLTHLRVDKIR